MKWHRQCQIEWLLTPTPGFTVAVRSTPQRRYAWYVWHHIDDATRRVECGGFGVGLRDTQKAAREAYAALTGGGS